MLKLFPTTALILSVAVGGIAFAGSAAASPDNPGARTNVYKNAQPYAHARPNPQSVEPKATMNEPYLYKNSQQAAHAQPRPSYQTYGQGYGNLPAKAPWPKVGPSPFKAPE